MPRFVIVGFAIACCERREGAVAEDVPPSPTLAVASLLLIPFSPFFLPNRTYSPAACCPSKPSTQQPGGVLSVRGAPLTPTAAAC